MLQNRIVRGSMKVALALAFVSLASACTPEKDVHLTSDPGGAEVTLDGKVVGTSPYDTHLVWTTGRDDDVIHATFRLPGYEDEKLSIRWQPAYQKNYHADMRKIPQAQLTAPQPTTPTTPAAPITACPTCGTKLPPSAKACPSCGTRLPQPKSDKCSNCGAALAAEARFCAACGQARQ